jgi:type VI secretion system secreted protein VgrG
MSDFDFTFAWEGAAASAGPWAHLQVVQFQGQEEISGLYRYEITLLAKAPAPEVNPHDLIGKRATLRIKTLTKPEYRVVHGVISEAEEISQNPNGMLYRVVVMPPLVRASFRRRCRIFLEKTTRQIIDAVLQGDSALRRVDGATVPDDSAIPDIFTPAAEQFTWRVADMSRIDDVSVRPYCVQYNESDLAFVSRLLEDEGISYHFENGEDLCLLVLSDRDGGRQRLDPFEPLGIAVDGREITSVKLGARLRAKSVVLDEYNWKKPALDMLAQANASGEDLFEYSYPGGFNEAPSQGVSLANVILERYGVEADYAVAEGKCRVISAGSVFHLQHAKSRYEGEYLVTRTRVRGEQAGILSQQAGDETVPFQIQIECARRGRDGSIAESRFRPARVTPRPRIVGSQTAFVTADPSSRGAEINVGGPPQAEVGCVRLRFHWDRENARLAKEPSSAWVRVSQTFAGVGQGGVWHPRVGVEVIVEFEEGDPDRPLVTGRVYNGANLPPAPSVGAATISTFKSFSSPGGGKHNEFMFDDAAGKEQIKLHAAKDWNNEVGNDRSETVGNNSTSGVGVNRSESTGADRSTAVGANNSEIIGANESVVVGASQSTVVGVNQSAVVGANQSVQVGANQTTGIGANHSVDVGANESVSVGAAQSITVGADQSVSVGASQSTSVGADQSITVGANLSITVGAANTITVGAAQTSAALGAQGIHSAASQTVTAPMQSFGCDVHQIDASALFMAHAGALGSVGAPLTIASGEAVLILSGPITFINGGTISINGGTIAINGGDISVTGGSVAVDGGGSIDMSAGVIKLN